MYSGQIRQTIKSWVGDFYLIMKLHKDLPSTRAIMSASGILLFYLGVWMDSKLQPFAKQQQAYFKSIQIILLTVHSLSYATI
jgi:hypothetical protein